MDTIKKPLDCGVYAILSWLDKLIDWQDLGCAIWSAQWDLQDDFKGYMWQFTDEFYINGNILYDATNKAR